MKSSRRGEQSGNYVDKKKYGKSGDKWTSRKLDRKSSRGMIYENEELRIRTININAEVERGQSDIRKLRRENEQLRREIWSLRDEYDRLNKLLKTPKNNNESSNCENDINSESITEDSDSCDTCKENDGIDCYDNYNISKSIVTELPVIASTSSYQQNQQSELQSSIISIPSTSSSSPPPPPPRRISSISNQQKQFKINYDIDNDNDDLTTTLRIDKYRNEKIISNLQKTNYNHVNFDHLSIVSEENLTNSDGNTSSIQQNDDNDIDIKYDYNNTITTINDKSIGSIKNMGDENDLQSSDIIPPLSHFENIINEQFSHNRDDSNYSTTTATTTGETVLAANGWDFNIQSPFSKKKQIHESVISSLSSSLIIPNQYDNNELPKIQYDDDKQQKHKSPKHFFSPIKPYLRNNYNINNNIICDDNYSGSNNDIIENTDIISTTPTIISTTSTPTPISTTLTNLSDNIMILNKSYKQNQHHHDRPDICFTNVLASPYNYTNYQHNNVTPSKCNSPTNSFQNGGNLEELLMDIESLSKDIHQMELNKQYDNNYYNDNKNIIINNEKQQYENNNIINMNLLKNRKPYRSEMNLVLNYNGNNSIPIIKKSTSTTSLNTIISKSNKNNNNNNYYINNNDNNQLDDNNVLIPNPMKLLPKNLQYLDFENYDKDNLIISSSSNQIVKPKELLLSKTVPIINSNLIDNIINKSQQEQSSLPQPSSSSSLSYQKPIILPTQLSKNYQHQQQNNYDIENYENLSINITPTSISSPISSINQSPLKIRHKLMGQFSYDDDGNDDNSHIINKKLLLESSSSTGSLITKSITSKLITDDTTIMNDGKVSTNGKLLNAKNKFFRTKTIKLDNNVNNCDSSSGSETTKRKNNRRVSILNFRNGSNNDKKNSQQLINDNDNKVKIKELENERNRITEENTITNKICLPLENSLSTDNNIYQNSHINNDNTSINDIRTLGDDDNIINNDIQQSIITTVHNPPKSPHSIGRRNSNVQYNNNNNNNNNNSNNNNQRHQHHHHHRRGSHHHRNHQCTRKMSQDSSSPTISTNTFTNIDNINNKCSRRHSESTVLSLQQQNINIDGNNFIDLNDSHQDIISSSGGGGGGGGSGFNVGGIIGTSISERNSNSLASSRESSTSLSMRSQRRKISINSHNGGKIPWCGCWGNGCL